MMSKFLPTSGDEALAFLTRQFLAPTPQNYALAFITINEPNSQIARAVQAIADNGLRMTQREADEIVTLYARDGVRTTPEAGAAERQALKRQADKLSEVTATAAAATHDFTQDLGAEVQALEEDAARTVQIVARMIERSKRTEDNFRFALREIETLRMELESAREDADRDALTGLPNRRCIERHLRQLAGRGIARTIGLCDIDHFKLFNDRFGHAVGDRVLKMVALTLATSCAPHFVGRWGGEEFVVVVEGDEQDECIALLDKAREELVGRKLKLRETDEHLGRITFSAGVAVANGDHTSNFVAIHRADTSLYAAKAAGRNQVLAT